MEEFINVTSIGDISDPNNCLLEKIDLVEEAAKLEARVRDGEIDLLAYGKKVYQLAKVFEKKWKDIQEQVFDDLESKYEKAELAEMGVMLKQTRRVDTNSFANDPEWNLAKQTLKNREELMKKAYLMMQENGGQYVFGDEIISPCSYGKSSKSVSFKL